MRNPFAKRASELEAEMKRDVARLEKDMAECDRRVKWAVSSETAWPDMKRISGLPDNCTAVNIRMRVDSIVTVTCMFASPFDGSLTAKRYELVEIPTVSGK